MANILTLSAADDSSSAWPITDRVNAISGNDGGSVKLPSATLGAFHVLNNQDSNARGNKYVFPQSADRFRGTNPRTGADYQPGESYELAPNSRVTVVCKEPGFWSTSAI